MPASGSACKGAAKEGYFLPPPDILKTLLPIKRTTITFIFKHPLNAFAYAEDLADKVHVLEAGVLDEPSDMGDRKKYARAFLDHLSAVFSKRKPVIELPYNPYIAFLVSIFRAKAGVNTKVLVLSFFHEDEAVENRAMEYRGFALDLKFHLLKSMLDYPFIKKIEIPLDEAITQKYIKKLLRNL
jgi:hypothetical protein